ncbi:MAG: hypothetical protein E7628_02790 [Ruminococcaceae bacterium]|nr:hypothetical protein [Oscillospiraceae bacterium]
MRHLKNLNINSESEAEEFVKQCEAQFSRDLDEAIEHVFDVEDVRIITLSGPTCSGKTTTATKLEERIERSGKNAVMLSIDDFFFGRDDRNDVDGEAPDYDSVKAIDLEYLQTFTADLLAGKTVHVPKFSFTEAKRVGYEEYTPDSRDIYIYEGIQAVYPEVTSLFGGKYRSVYIRLDEDVEYNGVVLDSNELRFLRRIVRDYKFRDATAEFSFHLWQTVRSNEEKNIFPYAKSDVYINSFLPYEPFIISHYAIDVLSTMPKDSQYRDEADALIEKLRVFDNPYFSDRMVPDNSVFREFIGAR